MIDPPSASPSEPDDLHVLLQYCRILWSYKWTLVICLAAGLLIATGVSLYTTPLYRARTSLEIQTARDPFGSQLMAVDSSMVTQSDWLRSATMRSRASEVLRSRPAPELPEVNEPLAWLRSLLGLSSPAETIAWNSAVSRASGTLTVTVPRDSRIVTIQSDSPNPRAAADFVNTLAQEFILRSHEDRREAYESTTALFSEGEEEIRAKLEQSEQELATFARTANLLITGDSTNIAEERMKQTMSALESARADRIARESLYLSSRESPETALPGVLDSGPMNQYQMQLATLRTRLAELSTTMLPAHPDIMKLESQIAELQRSAETERRNIVDRNKIELDAAVRREQELQRQFDSQTRLYTNQAELLLQYNRLKQEVETNRLLYQTTLQKSRETSIASAMSPNTARVVDPARVPSTPHKPSLPLNLALGLMGGLCCGTAFVVVRSRSDASVRVPGALGAYLNVRELGVIPSAKSDPDVKVLARRSGFALRGAKSERAGVAGGILTDGSADKARPADSLELVTWIRKPSVMAEAFRSVMTSILFSDDSGNRPKVLLLTSPSPQEGKSTVISNLAIALAEINQRVLLIDGDMRRPRLHSIFDVPNTFGLSDVLHERTPIERYGEEALVRRTSIPGLYVLPAGPARSGLSRLLHSSRMQELIESVRGSFDTVLIDTAPVLSVPDSRIIARVVDGVVLVLRAHKTNQDAAFAAARCFVEDGSPILGTILNDWDPSAAPYGYNSYYGAYQSPYHQVDRS